MLNLRQFTSKGFTLVEILIVVTIVGIITFSLINTFSKQRALLQYNEDTNKISGLVKLARNYASTNRSVYEGGENIVPAEGHGIYFERSSIPGESKMILFANTSAASPETKLQYDKGDKVEEIFIPKKEVILQNITFSQTGPPITETQVDRGVILFEITSAEVQLYDNGDPSNINALPTAFDGLSVDFVRLGDESGNSQKTFSIDTISGVPEMSL